MSWRWRLALAFLLAAIAVAFGIATLAHAATVTTTAEQLSELRKRVPVTKWERVGIIIQYGENEYGVWEPFLGPSGVLILKRQGGEWFTATERDAEFTTFISRIDRIFSAGLLLGVPDHMYATQHWCGRGDQDRILRNKQRFPIFFANLRGEFNITAVQVELPDGTKLGPPFLVE
ncbi:MAG: hypothetical protein WCV86_02185 [Patescibacteria group bacterium]|jgi:hypothetical protein